MSEQLSEESVEAVHKAKNAAQAVEFAREAQITAAVEATALKTKDMFVEALRDVFGENASSGRFVDVSRIPLICQSILGIDKKLDQLVTQNEFWPVKTLVYGITGLMLAGVVGALLVLVLKQ